jgi:glycyl-tRNA synthetase
MAEIEHYVDPKDKRHPRYAEAKDIVLNLLPKEVQEGGETTLTQMSIGDAVDKVSHGSVRTWVCPCL